MNKFTLLLLCVLVSPLGFTQERTDWSVFFDRLSAKGTIAVVDAREQRDVVWFYNQERANTRFSPASTFKIPHTLMALDAGLIDNEFQIFKWDGVHRSFSAHNQDQDLFSAMRNSAVWVYEQLAAELGKDKAAKYLKQLNYGNANPTFERGVYWIDGKLEISAYEQISFLQRLYKNELPFLLKHQQLVKKLIQVETEQDYTIFGKTGWDGQIGWWVGWIERANGPVFFALNIDTPNRQDDLVKRQQIVKDIMKSIGVI